MFKTRTPAEMQAAEVAYALRELAKMENTIAHIRAVLSDSLPGLNPGKSAQALRGLHKAAEGMETDLCGLTSCIESAAMAASDVAKND